ncbi:Fc.00g045930.m01.CDS01 [Cosmosporella sp. VM-42]
MSLRSPVAMAIARPLLQGLNLRRNARFTSTTTTKASQAPPSQTSALSRLPTGTLLRSLALTSLMSSQVFLKPCTAFLGLITTSKLTILNPDRNPFLNRILRWTVYNHFCAGTNLNEVSVSVSGVKKMGYQGIILGYSKEILLDPQDAGLRLDGARYGPKCYEMIEQWKKGTIETLRMVGPGDFLAVKLTGAGPVSVDAMQARQPIPEIVYKALDEICVATREQGSRLWLDAEQQVLQHGLDDWAIELMRRYNRDGQTLVYNTIQGYLKGSKANVDRHLALASKEGWSLGVKLVRGAYIEHEVCSLIHDTKEDTDRSYDLIADTLIGQKMPSELEDQPIPHVGLFLATHNAQSAAIAIATHRKRLSSGLPTVDLECGQVVGMADELSCELLQNYEQCMSDPSLSKAAVPRVFKCLTWGSVSECMGYLYRRAIENRGAVERTQHMAAALAQELRRRVFG